MSYRALRRAKPDLPLIGRVRRVKCPLCGARVSVAFGLRDHQRGRRCAEFQRIAAREAAGLRAIPSRVAAALLLDAELGPLIVSAPVSNSARSTAPVEGYWAPAWFASVLAIDDEPEDFGAFDLKFRNDSFTATAVRPGDAVRYVLRAMRDEDDDGREAFEGALRIGGLRAALALVDRPDDEAGDAATHAQASEDLAAALFGGDDDDDDDDD